MHWYVVSGVRLPLGDDPEDLPSIVAKKVGCLADDLLDVVILKRSLDARGRRHPNYDYRVKVQLDQRLSVLPSQVDVWEPTALPPFPIPPKGLRDEKIVVVGAGPAGLFAALALAERGINATVLERGKEVSARAKDVSRFLGRGELDPDSNICFGEGGAGTFSDGKLFTRIGGPEAERVVQWMVDLGAPEEILIDRRPHLGTDRLVKLLVSIRQRLLDAGTVFRFGACVKGIRRKQKRGEIVLRSGEKIEADRIILAVGHSARQLYRTLHEDGFAMEAKPFAVGLRVEHPQQLINEIQFGPYAKRATTPAADYRLAFNQRGGKGQYHVHTFCMCPGGSVVPTSTQDGSVCVNGMSHAARSGHYANSAIVTELTPGEIGDGGDRVLTGVRFQEMVERRAFQLGGGEFRAPASRLIDFVEGRASIRVRKTTYRRGVTPVDLSHCYPDFICQRLRAGIAHFETRMKGFLSGEAVLIGVETRTSSPIRILRDVSYRALNHPFVYPAGEGAGYAGGITSSAVDGLMITRQILDGS